MVMKQRNCVTITLVFSGIATPWSGGKLDAWRFQQKDKHVLDLNGRSRSFYGEHRTNPPLSAKI
jgi:hypothetical protein